MEILLFSLFSLFDRVIFLLFLCKCVSKEKETFNIWPKKCTICYRLYIWWKYGEREKNVILKAGHELAKLYFMLEKNVNIRDESWEEKNMKIFCQNFWDGLMQLRYIRSISINISSKAASVSAAAIVAEVATVAFGVTVNHFHATALYR